MDQTGGFAASSWLVQQIARVRSLVAFSYIAGVLGVARSRDSCKSGTT